MRGTTHRVGSAIVRVHGAPDQDKAKAATAEFLKKVVIRRAAASASDRSNAAGDRA